MMMIKIPQPAVDICNLTKVYGKTTVVDKLKLSIPKGTTFGLIGPNGAGKSTTLKMLMGVLSATSGTATIFGEDVSDKTSKLKTRIGYVPELHHTYSWMKVKEVIWFAKSFYPTWNEKMTTELLALFELDPNKKVKQLSKGMLAKLGLLIAVCHEPELLILDEPMSGLDPLVREEFLDGVLRSVCDTQCTVIFSSHTIDDIQRVADSVGLIYHGKLLVNRSVEGILTNTKRIRAVINNDDSPAWLPDSAIWQRVHKREWLLTVDEFTPEMVSRLEHKNPIKQVEVQDLSLEEVFKDYLKGKKEAA